MEPQHARAVSAAQRREADILHPTSISYVVVPPKVPRDPQTFFEDYRAFVRIGNRLHSALTAGVFTATAATGPLGLLAEAPTGYAYERTLRRVLPQSALVPFWAALETFALQKCGKISALLTDQYVTVMPLTGEQGMLAWCYFKQEECWFADLWHGQGPFGQGTRIIRAVSHIVH